MSQPARFAVRTKLLRDCKISAGAKVAFLLLDDEAKGEPRIYVKQHLLAFMLGIQRRELQYRLAELEEAGYLTTKRTTTGNVYEFVRSETHSGAQPDVHAHAHGMRTDVHKHLYRQEPLQEPPTPFGEVENQTPKTRCTECGDCGFVYAPGRIIRGMSEGARRVPCPRCESIRRRA